MDLVKNELFTKKINFVRNYKKAEKVSPILQASFAGANVVEKLVVVIFIFDSFTVIHLRLYLSIDEKFFNQL